jgi:chaperone LolA
MRLSIFALLLMSAVLPAFAQLDEGTLWTRLAGQEQSAGAFTQEIYSEDGELLEQSSGTYAVLRPDFFRWNIESPDRQQIIVTAAELWHYDLDLATATRRSTEGRAEFTPLELLGGASQELQARFAVQALENDRYLLRPLFTQAGFAAVELLWENGEIVEMDIRDRSGQRINIALRANPDSAELTPNDFELNLPDDVDIFDASNP